jgi:hypothetical protein
MSNRSIVDIFTDVVNQVTGLLHKESQLARTELSEKVGQAGVGIGLVVGGAVFLIPALVILLQAGVAALVKVIDEPWASLIVGGAAFLIGLLIAMIGASRLSAKNLTPNRTIHQIQRDVTVAKQQVRERDSYEEQRAA